MVAGSFSGFYFMFLQKGLQQSCDLYRHKVVDDYDVLNIDWVISCSVSHAICSSHSPLSHIDQLHVLANFYWKSFWFIVAGFCTERCLEWFQLCYISQYKVASFGSSSEVKFIQWPSHTGHLVLEVRCTLHTHIKPCTVGVLYLTACCRIWVCHASTLII